MDPVQRDMAVRAEAAFAEDRARLADERARLRSRPGPRYCADAAVEREAEAAWQARNAYYASAWRGGHVQVPAKAEAPPPLTGDTQVDTALQAAHWEAERQRAYDQRSHWLRIAHQAGRAAA